MSYVMINSFGVVKILIGNYLGIFNAPLFIGIVNVFSICEMESYSVFRLRNGPT